MQNSRYGSSGLIGQEPCSTSVTSATGGTAAARAVPLRASLYRNPPVPRHIDALVIAAARLRDRLELAHDYVDLDLGILQETSPLVSPRL